MSILLTIIHVLICLVLVAAVLLQSGKAADLAGAFGGAGSATAFGPRGTASIMAKITTVCAILFMVTSIGFSLLTKTEESRMKDTTQTQEKTSPGPTSTIPEKKTGGETQPPAAESKAAGQPSTTQPQSSPSKPAEPAKKQL